jgi:hypothetical protein
MIYKEMKQVLRNVKGTPVVSYSNRDGEVLFVMTRDNKAVKPFSLYRIFDMKAIKLGSSNSPLELEEKFDVNKTILEGQS